MWISDRKFVNCMMWDGKKVLSQSIFKKVSPINSTIVFSPCNKIQCRILYICTYVHNMYIILVPITLS